MMQQTETLTTERNRWEMMPDLSIKVGFRGPLLAKNEKAKTRKNQGFMQVFCVAGAVGLEPTTNGFGVAQNVRKPLKLLAFSSAFRASKPKMLCSDAFLMLCPEFASLYPHGFFDDAQN